MSSGSYLAVSSTHTHIQISHAKQQQKKIWKKKPEEKLIPPKQLIGNDLCIGEKILDIKDKIGVIVK